MNGFLPEFADLGREVFVAGFAVFLRVGTAMALLPAVGERSVPQRIRLVLALAYTAVVAPAVISAIPASTEGAENFLLWASEVAAGLAIGIGLRLFIIALQVAGSMAAQASSLAQLFGGEAADPVPAIGQLLVIGGLALAVTAGLHVRIAELLIFSYEMLPPGRMPQAEALTSWGVAGVTRMFSLAFSLAAPLVIASLIYNIALGAINRAMPQLLVSFVGAPAISAGALILLALSAPFMLAAWLEALGGFLDSPFTWTP
jgi:flagellar biosynthetic protein FliR